VSTGKFKLEKK